MPASFHIASLPVYGRLILSPMDGFSDLPFRSLCRDLGSAMSYTEFINTLDVLQGHPRFEQKLAYLPSERPVVFQIFDEDPQRLLETSLRLQEYGPDVIDINMGCSARNVSGRGAGAGLLCTPLKIARIFRTLSRSLEVPLTGKIRLGWDDENRNYRLVARIIEENGGALVAVHGRTRAQEYGGRSDWQAIAEVKAAVSIPVIGNGDVRSPADARRMLAQTGVDGVMIGRAAIGNPWIFAGLERDRVPPAQVFRTVRTHLERMLGFYPDDYGLVLFRKHAVRYLRRLPLDREQRKRLFEEDDPQVFLARLSDVLGLQAAQPVPGLSSLRCSTHLFL